jgi:predicted N-formylglutamate amidohydrolase
VTSTPLLSSDEPSAVELVNIEGGGNAVLVCDHASNRVPRRLDNLGLDALQLADHIGWDPGAAEVARGLSTQLDAPLVLSGYSRLVIDCNRPLSSPGSIAEQSADIDIPGNSGLTPEDRKARIDALFLPYHRAIDRLLDSRALRPTLLLSIHSFTPILNGRLRPWSIGISYGRDQHLAKLLLRALAQWEDLAVGENEPYPIETDIDYTLPQHGEGRGLLCVMIEIRQDGLRTAEDARAWAARLATAYRLIEAEVLLR